MRFPLYVSLRYLFSRKSTHVINIISGISTLGVILSTAALVITLSVFNGFYDLVASLLTAFDPDIKVIPKEGKFIPADDPALDLIRQMSTVSVACDVVEDQALIIYHDRQVVGIVKGVKGDDFAKLSNIENILIGKEYGGDFTLSVAGLDFGIPGLQLAETLGTGIWHKDPITVYAPVREGLPDFSTSLESSFTSGELYSPGVIFNVKQAKYDNRYLLTDISFARNLFGVQGMVSALELKLTSGSDISVVKSDIMRLGEGRYIALDRFEQQEDTFRIMKVEKLIAYIFLTFILTIACFNVVGCISMLIIDKREDVLTLCSMGANDRLIRRIFFFEGRIICVIGALIGVCIGLILCRLQQVYGLVGLGRSSGSFIVDSYPVSIHFSDILITFFTVIAVGWVAVYYPVKVFSKRLLKGVSFGKQEDAE